MARDTPLREVFAAIQRGNKQIALVVDGERRLLGTITDGDTRRAILGGLSLTEPAQRLLGGAPVTLPVGVSDEELLDTMRTRQVRHIPLLDRQGRVVDLVWISDLLCELGPGIPAVLMVGGEGRRLRPLTDELPKPLLPVGERPLLEIIVQRLREAGIQRLHFATHYRGQQILDHFGDGHAFGVEISYLEEQTPLGTAGALSKLAAQTGPVLVMNGDVLTQVDFSSLIAFHREHRAQMTVCVKEYTVDVPYGVVEMEGAEVRRVVEKPTLKFFVNAGIYLLEPAAISRVPAGRRYDMPQLIQDLVASGATVVSFPIQGSWIDVGEHEHYRRAQGGA